MQLLLKRVYDPAEPTDGFRVLVDRLWPRGVSKERAAIDLWAKDVTPSTELRKAWHAASADEWNKYAVEYRHQLEHESAPAVAQLRETLAPHAIVTLVYASHDTVHNHVRVLMEVLTE